MLQAGQVACVDGDRDGRQGTTDAWWADPHPADTTLSPALATPPRRRPVLPALQALEKPKIWLLSEIFSFFDVGKYFIKKTCCEPHTAACRSAAFLSRRGCGGAEGTGP